MNYMITHFYIICIYFNYNQKTQIIILTNYYFLFLTLNLHEIDIKFGRTFFASK